MKKMLKEVEDLCRVAGDFQMVHLRNRSIDAAHRAVFFDHKHLENLQNYLRLQVPMLLHRMVLMQSLFHSQSQKKFR